MRKYRGIIGKIDTASAYQECCKKAPKGAIVMSIIIFGDGTVIDGAMQKSLEPYSFTLAIFWQCVRGLPIAWCNLGYMKKLYLHSSQDTQTLQHYSEQVQHTFPPPPEKHSPTTKVWITVIP